MHTLQEALQEESDDNDDSQYYSERKSKDFTVERSSFTFCESPAPPPAPLAPEVSASARDSPTIPEYSQTEFGGTYLDDHEDSMAGNDADDDDDDADSETQTPSPVHKSAAPPCETPVIENIQSEVSSTPLLGSDTTGRKSARFRKRTYPTNDDSSTRMPPTPGSNRSSKYIAPQYASKGYFRNSGSSGSGGGRISGSGGGNQQAPPAADNTWGNDGSQSEVSYDGKNSGYAPGSEPYTWSRRQDQNRPQSSSALSESSVPDTSDGHGFSSHRHRSEP